jgi:hypothetical protein
MLPILAQPFMPHSPVVVLDIGILLGLTGLNMADADLQFLSPCRSPQRPQ